MTLVCQCGSHALAIVDQSYGEDSALEVYECEDCGATGTLTMQDRGGRIDERLSGCLESDLA